MKSAEEIQGAITAVSGWQRNPASLGLITKSEKFKAQMPGILAALKWAAGDDEEAFLIMVTELVEGTKAPKATTGQKKKPGPHAGTVSTPAATRPSTPGPAAPGRTGASA
jgi:hypothetical protein